MPSYSDFIGFCSFEAGSHHVTLAVLELNYVGQAGPELNRDQTVSSLQELRLKLYASIPGIIVTLNPEPNWVLTLPLFSKVKRK